MDVYFFTPRAALIIYNFYNTHRSLMKVGLPKTPAIPKFLADLAVKARKNDAGKTYRIGIDPFVHSASFAKELEEAIATAQETFALTNTTDIDSSSIKAAPLSVIDTLDDHGNLIDILWGNDRPPIPTSPFRVHPIEYAGMTVQEKVAHIRKCMTEESATLCVFPALDDVAYILNVRAKGDVECNPVGIAYCAVTQDEVTLYCDAEHKLSDASVKQYLLDAGVAICPYDDIVSDILKHLEQKQKVARVWMDKTRCNYALVRCIPPKQLLDKQNPITPLKACKNAAEMEGMRQAHIVDGVAMAHFIAWLQDAVVYQKRRVSEVEIDLVLTSFRAQQEGFFDLSFPTIAGVGSNGAIIHYRAKEGTDLMKYLDTTQPILLDSGGQYYYGTTDVTRVSVSPLFLYK
jgi:Xaa-Pro aminopeptidase